MLLDDLDYWIGVAPNAVAIRSNGRCVHYSELALMAHAVAKALVTHGVNPGDRVALYMPKDPFAVACVLGALYAGAAFVPVDPRAPLPRVTQVLEDCFPHALIGHRPFLERLDAFNPHALANIPALFVDETSLDRAVVLDLERQASTQSLGYPRPEPGNPAYILYTSGSTGKPKGVVVSHEAAWQFVRWARQTFLLDPSDRLANFAPLCFDLSVFDLFGALSSGASVDLVAQEMLLRPVELVRCLFDWHTTTIYAVPSTITLLERDGNLGDMVLPELRRVLYAGEPYFVPHLVAAMQALPHARFFNLFGPTETNVCTYHALSEVPTPNDTQVPIGVACDHLTVDLLDDRANPVKQGEEGELCVAGPAVMTEYFGDPQATVAAFHPGSRFPDRRRRYRTGDRATADSNGRFWFRGRRDRLIKRHGYRIELGDIESALQRHPDVGEAAAVATIVDSRMQIRVFVALNRQVRVSALNLRAHCGTLLPPYMVPDSVEILDELPRSTTGKVDFQLLRDRTFCP